MYDDTVIINDDALATSCWEWVEAPILGRYRRKLPNNGRCQECKKRGRAETVIVQETKPLRGVFSSEFSYRTAKGGQQAIKLAAPATRRKNGKIMCETCSGASGTKLNIDKPVKQGRKVSTQPLLLASSDRVQFTT